SAWRADMARGLPDIFCRSETYFRKCFKVKTEQCRKEIRLQFALCYHRMEPDMPAELKQPEDGALWGGKFRACMGEYYKQSLTGEKLAIESDDCKDPTKWGVKPR